MNIIAAIDPAMLASDDLKDVVAFELVALAAQHRATRAGFAFTAWERSADFEGRPSEDPARCEIVFLLVGERGANGAIARARIAEAQVNRIPGRQPGLTEWHSVDVATEMVGRWADALRSAFRAADIAERLTPLAQELGLSADEQASALRGAIRRTARIDTEAVSPQEAPFESRPRDRLN